MPAHFLSKYITITANHGTNVDFYQRVEGSWIKKARQFGHYQIQADLFYLIACLTGGSLNIKTILYLVVN